MLKEEAIINFAELVSERLVLFSGAWRFGPPEGSAGRCLSEENTVFLCPEPRAARHQSPFLSFCKIDLKNVTGKHRELPVQV